MFNIKKIHFIGISGTLMGNAAIYLQRQGYEVRGSDRAFYPPIGDMLKNEKMFIYEGFDENNLDWKPDLVIIGNSISRGNPEAERTLNERMNFMALPELLKYMFIKEKNSIVVSGTHGKTSTTSIISKIFSDAGKDPSYLIGGIPVGSDTGFKHGSGEYFIIEGDEYDTAFFDKRPKFVHYKPHCLIINNIEFDHGDIYRDIDHIKLEFTRLVNIVPSNGLIIANFDEQNVRDVTAKALTPIASFGQGENCKWQIRNIRHECDMTAFDLYDQDELVISPVVRRCGTYQIYNFTASIIASLFYDLDKNTILKTLETFEGVKRRMEYRGKVNGAQLIEDFAHHPTAVRNVLTEVRGQYPDKKIIAAFEPRSNTTKRNIFQNELAEALSIADDVIVGKIDREDQLKSDEKLDMNKLLDDIRVKGKTVVHYDDSSEIAEYIKSKADEDSVILIMTNGSFDGLFTKLGV
ncbi:MAG: UDP-N-acetylmuramate:L-alanyl-gamma-D-glutamyl-meso-diaminopimelate ligase [Candidatus Delongbacteria bacterium]|nr:UDP-N-acetylmuramate:L-alanyl-gamma-D-glutamyl-meso-diaminopimelate ligase [Candidatus Delongbacteria bacterium]